MQFRQAKDFPYCDNYLKYFLKPENLKQQHPRVWGAFRNICESEQLATEGLTFGKGPLVYIGCVPAGKQGKYSGPQRIVFIHTLVAFLYEKHTHPQLSLWQREKAKKNLFDWMPWEATVLHEIVHWARHVGRKSEEFNGGEAGTAFEERAYGIEGGIKSFATMGRGRDSQCEIDTPPPWPPYGKSA